MTQDERRRIVPLATRAALASVAVALFLLGLKTWAAWRTGSVAMLGSLADTGLDLFASLVTLYGVRLAATPADHDHRFGHGKAEALAALFQVALITASAIVIGLAPTIFSLMRSPAIITRSGFNLLIRATIPASRAGGMSGPWTWRSDMSTASIGDADAGQSAKPTCARRMTGAAVASR